LTELKPLLHYAVFIRTASFFFRRNSLSIRKLPDYRLKQKILYIDKTSAASLASYGDLYLEAGALSDALDFYAKAGHRDGVQKIKDMALVSGDAFLFQGAAKALNIELRDADWEEIARRATELKKYLFARHALEKTNNTELLNTLTTKMKAEETKQSE
jgi:hypothetical protein